MSGESVPQNGGHLGVVAPDGRTYDVLWARRGVAMRGNEPGDATMSSDGTVGTVVGFVVGLVISLVLEAVWDAVGVWGVERKVAVYRRRRVGMKRLGKVRVADQDAADALVERLCRGIEAGGRPWEELPSRGGGLRRRWPRRRRAGRRRRARPPAADGS